MKLLYYATLKDQETCVFGCIISRLSAVKKGTMHKKDKTKLQIWLTNIWLYTDNILKSRHCSAIIYRGNKSKAAIEGHEQ